jgi:uncharacterized protein
VLRLEADGRYYLVTPAEKMLIEVEDVPFLVVAMEAKGSGKDQRLSFQTTLDDRVEAGAEHPLSFRAADDGSFTPYILVRDKLKARLARPVYYELIEAAVSESRDGRHRLGVWSGGMFFAFPAPDGADQD